LTPGHPTIRIPEQGDAQYIGKDTDNRYYSGCPVQGFPMKSGLVVLRFLHIPARRPPAVLRTGMAGGSLIQPARLVWARTMVGRYSNRGDASKFREWL